MNLRSECLKHLEMLINRSGDEIVPTWETDRDSAEFGQQGTYKIIRRPIARRLAWINHSAVYAARVDDDIFAVSFYFHANVTAYPRNNIDILYMWNAFQLHDIVRQTSSDKQRKRAVLRSRYMYMSVQRA
ncbi:hypothetical protein D3C85_1140660 [compost metagenome]